jgi:hypothetical protein
MLSDYGPVERLWAEASQEQRKAWLEDDLLRMTAPKANEKTAVDFSGAAPRVDSACGGGASHDRFGKPATTGGRGRMMASFAPLGEVAFAP